MTTLDDLTPQERAGYVGAWVNVPHNPRPVIYMRDFYSTGEIKHGAIFLDPLYGDNHARLEECVTRPDLPRAWMPNGEPVNGDYEYAAQYQDFTGEWDYPEASPWKPTAEEARDEEQTLQLTGFTTRIVRRLVSEPEEVQP